MEPPRSFPAEALPVFREGINLTLSRWSALQMAVENEWGGRSSRARANQLADDIFSWFTQMKEPLTSDELCEKAVELDKKLDDCLIALNTEAEDDSISEVADELWVLYGECADGDYSSVEKLRKACAHRTAPSHVRQVVNDDDDDSDSDADNMEENNSEMMVDASNPSTNPVKMQIDEQRPSQVAEASEGWTVVVGSRKSKGRKK